MKRRKFIEKFSLFTGLSSFFGISIVNKQASNTKAEDIDILVDNENKTPTDIQVTTPATVKLNETFWVGIRILTEPFYTKWIPQWQRTKATVNGPFNKSSRGIHYMDNVLPEWEGTVNISGGKGFKGDEKYMFSDGTGPYEYDNRPIRKLEGFSFSEPGIKYIRVQDEDTGVIGLSNPIQVVEGKIEEQLFWGDLHCHSFFGDGIRCPEEIYAFARDETFLDVFALTEHTEALMDNQWDYFKKVTNKFNKPGKFVTFLGGEWTSRKYGHRNYIYPDSSGPLIRSTDPKYNDLTKLHAIARSHNALIIVNHPAGVEYHNDWTQYQDSDVERLSEVYSIGGIYEMSSNRSDSLTSNRNLDKAATEGFLVDAFENGHRLGMIGVGDTHDGRPGDALHQLQEKPSSYRFLQEPGLMGIWAKELTRESIFDALWNRRVYGTTNNRTWLKFSINDQPMGSVIKYDGKITAKIAAASNLIIKRIDLMHESNVKQIFKPEKLQTSWKPKLENISIKGSTWFYIRLILDEGHFAWSSPIWINND